jgi:hypothetical protein
MDAAAIGLLALVLTSAIFLLGLRELLAGRARAGPCRFPVGDWQRLGLRRPGWGWGGGGGPGL